jgi:phage shock protein C
LKKYAFAPFGIKKKRVILQPRTSFRAKAEQKTKANMEKKKLYRSIMDKKLCGVCGGLAEYFDVDSTLIRLLWVCATLFSACFPGLLAYIVCALIMPQQYQLPNP